MSQSCNCSSAPKLILACSGAADVGELTDCVARQLTKAGVGKMYCLAGIGGGIPAILENARAASAILAIDGCPSSCASMSLKKAGFSDFAQIQLAALDMAKGQTPVTPENIEHVITVARATLENC
ncbi:putative zinc-binding protein [Uliginosibacterium gangwonense]|uniref:putative zinc-binding protein n=1 Tax=Uliginosibacterium gangwonense TaxID=392736 RepID=UPI000360D310|nr:putative zinc-binding protein [Uliginosibacterium gangwonense]